MSGVRIEGDIDRIRQALSNIRNVDFTGLNEAIGDALVTSTAMRFRHEEDPEGRKWKKSIRAQQENGKTLSKSADLKTSINSRATSEGVAVGTNKIYAPTHQFGSEDAPGGVFTIRAKSSKGLRFRIGDRWITKQQVKVKMPKREFLGVSEADYVEIRAMVEETVRRLADD